MNARISAPAKIILFGEHAAVYGYPAIAASINLRALLQLSRELSTDQSSNLAYVVDFKNLSDSPVHVLVTHLDHIHACESNLLHCACMLSRTVTHKEDSSVCNSLAVIFLLEELIHRRFPKTVCPARQHASRLRIESDIPIGAGLGSSAALCTVIAGSLLLLHGIIADTEQESSLSLIQIFAHEAEKIIHSMPSGVDTVVSTQGGIILFKNQPKHFESILKPTEDSSCRKNSNKLLIVDTLVSRSTKEAVLGVATLRTEQPDFCRRIFDEIGAICAEAIEQLKLGCWRLDELVLRNQVLLRELGVSHPVLDAISACLWEKAGVGCKLTGAGKGGCAIALLDGETEYAHIVDLLCPLNVRIMLTEFCVPGVQIEVIKN